MNKKLYIMILVAIAVLVVLFVWRQFADTTLVVAYDDFAKCIASKGTIMYGVEWCSHCQNEKKALGDSFKYIPYVECPTDPNKCVSLGINGYPTWIFGDGRRHEGELGLTGLSRETGCELPKAEDSSK
jgi:hypothetical protein